MFHKKPGALDDTAVEVVHHELFKSAVAILEGMQNRKENLPPQGNLNLFSKASVEQHPLEKYIEEDETLGWRNYGNLMQAARALHSRVSAMDEHAFIAFVNAVTGTPFERDQIIAFQQRPIMHLIAFLALSQQIKEPASQVDIAKRLLQVGSETNDDNRKPTIYQEYADIQKEYTDAAPTMRRSTDW